jgi:diguanylate cyclase (GGDEF)-like protein
VPATEQITQEVVSMLALRESAAVPPWAAARLAAFCGGGVARVLRVFPAAAARTQGENHSEFAVAVDSADIDELPSPAGADQPLLAAMRERKPIAVAAEGGKRLLVPLCASDEVRYVLEIPVAASRGAGEALADALIRLVGSYYDLLADAETDPLTRLSNRRVFYSQVADGMARWAAGPIKRYLAMIDIDHFKQVNDRFGHLYGDEILIHFARLMHKTFRAGDLLYRFGGEEFVIVFGVARAEDRHIPLERFRSAVESYAFPRVGRVTASIGFTGIGAVVPVTTVVDRADGAVYFAKRNGRNRVCEYETLVAEGVLKEPEPEAGGEATLF